MTNEEIKRARKLLAREREIVDELTEIHKKWCWEDRLPYIHKLNEEKKAINRELDKILSITEDEK